MAGPYYLHIRRPGKKVFAFPLKPGVYPIGSDPDNRVILPDESVAWRHAILSALSDGLFIEDLSSPVGTLRNGVRLEGRRPLSVGDKLQIGIFTLSVRLEAEAPSEEPATPTEFRKEPSPAPAPPAPAAEGPPEAPRSEAQEDDLRQRSIRRQIQNELLKRLDLKRLTADHVDERDLRVRARETIGSIIREVRDRLPPDIDPERLAQEVCNEALGLGPLEDLLEDPDITEIMVNGPDRVFIERGGKLHATGKTFLDDDSVLAIIERIVSPIGRRIDESQPYVDARLMDGSRVNAIIHPLSLTGPCLTIRKFSKTPFSTEDLVRFGTWNAAMLDFLRLSVLTRKNILISGGTGSGKTTLLNVISGFLPPDERIITIEDAAELRLHQPHVVRLEARPPNLEGKGAVTVRDLVRNALRMRPDRIVVGEVRGGEALDMLQAMNTGHEGSLTTVHANGPRDAIARLETMVLMAGMDLPLRAVREQIASAIHLIVHETRFSDGSRKVSGISEVVGIEGDQITMQDIFEFRQTGTDADGRVMGSFMPTGSVPTFIEEARVRGIPFRADLFDPSRRPA